MKRYLFIAVALLLFSTGTLSFFYISVLKDRNRLAGNQSSLLSEVKYYKLSDSTNISVIGSLTFSLSEINRATNAEISAMKSTLKLMDIKLKNLESYSTVNTETQTTIHSFLRDSVIYDTVPVKYLACSTKWNEVELSVFPTLKDSISLKVTTRDKMTQVVHKDPREWKFWSKTFWRKRPLKQTIRFENPNTVISYPSHIVISK